MAFDREAAKQAGYTDEEINAYLQANPAVQREAKRAEAVSTTDVNEPPAPTTKVEAITPSTASVATSGLLAAAPYVGSAALGAGGLYGAKVVKEGITALRENAAARAAAEQGIQNRFEQRMGQQAAQQVAQAARPVAPSPILDAAGRPMMPTGTAPVAPTGTAPVAPQAAAASEASLLDKTTAMIRQLAANKVLQNVVKGGVGLTAALMPGNVGQNYMFPQTGRMKGQEINLLTGLPWTKEQLDAYNANPAAFDAQLPPPQMPR